MDAASWATHGFQGVGLEAVYGPLGFRYVYGAYIGGDPLTCSEVHDIAVTNGYYGHGTILNDTGFIIYNAVMNDRRGSPQFIVLDRQLHIRAHVQGWDPATNPAFFQSLIEALLLE